MDRIEVLNLAVVKQKSDIILSSINVYKKVYDECCYDDGYEYDYVTINLCEDKPRVKVGRELNKQCIINVFDDYLHWWDDIDVEFLADKGLDEDYRQLAIEYIMKKRAIRDGSKLKKTK